MNAISESIVKVDAAGSISTGFIYKSEGEYIYIITCRHGIVDVENRINQDNIAIRFFDEKETTYQLTEADEIITGLANDEDYAVIITSIKNIPLINIDTFLSAAVLTGDENECIITGVPKFVQNEFRRTLYKIKILSDKDYEHQIQLEVADPVINNYNADVLLEGYSGSPILIQSGLEYFFCGILLGYEEQSKRILGIQFSIINKRLEELGYHQINARAVETNPQILNDISKVRANSSRVLDRINDKIGTVHLDRDSVNRRVGSLIIDHTFVLISGRSGIGKSATTKQALLNLHKEYEIIALQGEQLDKPSLDEVFGESGLNIETSFRQLLKSYGMKGKKIVWIDSIEKLLETSNANTILDFFTLLKAHSTLKTVLTCRTYAVEQLNIRFLQQIASIVNYDIPLLSDEELTTISESYPVLTDLLAKPALRSILKIPFNIDKATLIKNKEIYTDVQNESDFRHLAWKYIIENLQMEPDVKIRVHRGELLENVALERATQMTPFISVPTDSIPIAQMLLQDNILEQDPVSNRRYAASHDIYEDWAITRFVEDKFNTTFLVDNNIESFFQHIGYAPAIRRAFRIWISEKIQNIDYNTKRLLESSLKNSNVNSYWKDEILIAIVQSEYSHDFLEKSKALLFADNFILFKRCALLLNVACQQPDFSYLSLIEGEKKLESYNSALLKPYGPGWANMIEFIHSSSGDLNECYDIVIPIVLQWGKHINTSKLPKESKKVGLIILEYFENYRRLAEEDKYPIKEYIDSCVELLYQLCVVLKDEITTILLTALDYDKRRNYRVSSLYDTLINKSLSWSHSIQLCQHLPTLIIKVAEAKWFYYPPSDEELEERYKNSPFKSLPRVEEKEEVFGVVKDHRYNYFPSSAYQTPIMHLLLFAPHETIMFITRLFNHSANAFWKSDFLITESPFMAADQRENCVIELEDGSNVVQKGCLTLWLIYRGTYIATPYLLQSVLMSLEKWLLNLARIVDKGHDDPNFSKSQALMNAINCLVKESNSVSTTAVVVSVLLAYPKVFIPKLFFILRVKQFYSWDQQRRFHEHSALSTLGSGSMGRFIQKERYESNQIPHRKETLEGLMLNLGIGNNREDVYGIIDEFYSEEDISENWKFVLNRIDARKLEIIDSHPGGFIVQTKLDDELKPVAEKAKEDRNKMLPHQNAVNWAIKKLHQDPVENDSIEEWRKHYRASYGPGGNNSDNKIFSNSAVIACIGLRDYYEHLTPQELKWSTSTIINVAKDHLDNQIKGKIIDLDSQVGPFKVEAAMTALLYIIVKSNEQEQRNAKEIFFLSLLFVHNNDVERDRMLSEIKILWDKESDFACACVAGVIEYSKIAWMRTRIDHACQTLPDLQTSEEYKEGKKKNILSRLLEYLNKLFHYKKKNPQVLSSEVQKFINDFNQRMYVIINDVLDSKSNTTTIYQNNERVSAYYLLNVIQLIPSDTTIQKLQEHYSQVIEYIFNNIEENDTYADNKINSTHINIFEKHFTLFILTQPSEVAMEIYKTLVDPIFTSEAKYRRNAIDFVRKCLQRILSESRNNVKYCRSFWEMWEYLSEKSTESGKYYFAKELLIDIDFWYDSDEPWQCINGKKGFFDKLIPLLNELKSCVKLIAGIGFDELMPDAILLLQPLIKRNGIDDKYEIYYLEKLVMKIFYHETMRGIIRNNTALRNAFIEILDELINHNSSSAFLIREDFISMRA